MLTKIAFWPRRCVKGQLRCQFCGKKWKCNFLHAANVAVLRPRSCSGQQEQGGDVAKLTFHISRHLPSAPICHLPSAICTHHRPRAGSGSGVRYQAGRPVPARLPHKPRRHRPSQSRGGGGLPARQGRSRFFTQNPSLSRENMGYEAAGRGLNIEPLFPAIIAAPHTPPAAGKRPGPMRGFGRGVAVAGYGRCLPKLHFGLRAVF